MLLARFPRIFLAHLPTPLEPLDRLSRGPRRARDLDQAGRLHRPFHRRQQDAQAGVPDGRGRGAGCRYGDDPGRDAVEPRPPDRCFRGEARASSCHILLEDRTGSDDPNYNTNGNVLLDHLHGATTEKRPGGADMHAEMEKVADRLRADGRRVYTIPGGGSNPTGALGYVNCALELVGQANDRGLRDRSSGACDRQRRDPGGAGRRAEGDQCRHPAARHRRARAAGRSRRRMSSTSR